MKRIRCTSLLLALSLCISTVAYAGISAVPDTDSQSIRISGETEYKNSSVSVRLDKGGIYYLLKQFKTNGEGKFDYEYPLSIPTDDYTIKLKFSGGELWSDTITFINSDDVVALYGSVKSEIEALKQAETLEFTALKCLIEGNRGLIPEINFTDYDIISATIIDGKSEIDKVYTYAIDNIPGSLGEFARQLNKGILLKNVISSKDKDVFEQNADDMTIAGLPCYAIYQSFSDEGKTAVLGKLAMPKSDKELVDNFERHTLVQGISEKNYREYDSVLLSCSNSIESSIMASYTALSDIKKVDVAKILYQQTINNYTEFVTAMRSAIDSVKNAVSAPAGGGGGGGGGKPISPVAGVIVTPSKPVVQNAVNFEDLTGFDWAKDAIVTLSNNGIIAGKSSTQFCPADKITKEEFLALIMRGFNIMETEGHSTFSDVDDNVWYAKTVATATKLGIASGVSEDTFGTGRPVTRQEMCVLAHRTAVMNNVLFKKGGDIPFEDRIATWAENAISELYSSGIVSGVGEKQFMAEAGATRAEASIIVYKLLMFANRL